MINNVTYYSNELRSLLQNQLVYSQGIDADASEQIIKRVCSVYLSELIKLEELKEEKWTSLSRK